MIINYLLRFAYVFVFFFFLMIQPPPRSTRTDTLFPYTTLFRSILPELIDDQARCLLEDMTVHAIKVGPLYTTESVSVLAQIAADYSHVPDRKSTRLNSSH